MDTEGRDSTAPPDSKQVGVSSKTQADTAVTSSTSIPHTDVYHMGVPSQRPLALSQRQGQRPLQKWKGPDKISRIYGEWKPLFYLISFMFCFLHCSFFV